MCAEAAWLATVQSTHHHEVNAMLKLSQLRSEAFSVFFRAIRLSRWNAYMRDSVGRMRNENKIRGSRTMYDGIEWVPWCMMAGWWWWWQRRSNDFHTSIKFARTPPWLRAFEDTIFSLADCFVRTKRTTFVSLRWLPAQHNTHSHKSSSMKRNPYHSVSK